MIDVYNEEFVVETAGRGFYEITDRISSTVDKSGVRNGIATIFIQHTSASLIIFENADPTARRDLERFFARLVPEGIPDYTHSAEGPDDMPSHIRMVLTRTSETIPIVKGSLRLGTWQGVFIYEHRRRSELRSIGVSVIGSAS
jgi:secondary thiamine-phosphate synthase enzyme